MSALLDELKSVLTVFRETVAGQVNSGLLVTIDGHLAHLAAAAENGVQAAEQAVHNVLGELYGALHGAPAPAAPAETPAPPVDAPAPVAEQPLATGGTVTSPPPIVGESGPESLALPTAPPVEAPAPAVEETATVPAAAPTTPEAAV